MFATICFGYSGQIKVCMSWKKIFEGHEKSALEECKGAEDLKGTPRDKIARTRIMYRC
jgi:hypothetical protein